jgi:hypothetical protein
MRTLLRASSVRKHVGLLREMLKTARTTPGDNCLAEFTYSLNRKGVEKMIAVVMEPSCRDTSHWQGAVGLRLGATLYVDLSADGQV